MKQAEPTLLKVDRVGDDWMVRWSTDDKWRSEITGLPLSVHFEVYGITGFGVGEDAEKTYFTRDDAASSIDTVETLDEAEADFTGFIKWDGCGHLMVTDNTRNCMYHICGPEDAKRLAALLPKLWEMAQALMPGYEV